jgi:tetratricopeptide (TPR) repeat protein
VPRRGIVLAALAAAAFGVGLAAGASRDAATPPARVAAGAHHSVVHRVARAHRSAHHRTPARPKSTVTAAPAAARTPPPTADTLEARGHQLMLNGDYAAAIPILRQAVAAADPNSLTYAYALFDLGHSLRVSGDPRAAIPILYRRLQIPNQTGVVRAELQAALQAVGAQVRGGGTATGAAAGPAGGPAGSGGPPGHGKHKGHGGGD